MEAQLRLGRATIVAARGHDAAGTACACLDSCGLVAGPSVPTPPPYVWTCPKIEEGCPDPLSALPSVSATSCAWRGKTCTFVVGACSECPVTCDDKGKIEAFGCIG